MGSLTVTRTFADLELFSITFTADALGGSVMKVALCTPAAKLLSRDACTSYWVPEVRPVRLMTAVPGVAVVLVPSSGGSLQEFETDSRYCRYTVLVVVPALAMVMVAVALVWVSPEIATLETPGPDDVVVKVVDLAPSLKSPVRVASTLYWVSAASPVRSTTLVAVSVVGSGWIVIQLPDGVVWYRKDMVWVLPLFAAMVTVTFAVVSVFSVTSSFETLGGWVVKSMLLVASVAGKVSS